MSEEELTVDRTGWPSGPWDGEPDRIEWRMSEPPGYPLLIVRAPTGSLSGYVGVPPGHPAHGNEWNGEVALKLDVHGGVTYGAGCLGHICHVPEPGEDEDVWWLGFDTGHAWDFAPGIPGWPPGTYRDVSYVRAEVENLSKQLAALA